MSFPRYPKYKSSGVDWLDEVPEHWEVRRLGFYFTERREKVSDKDFEPLSVTKNGVVAQLETAAKTDDGDNRKKVCKGDFVINSRSDRKGSAGMALQDGSVSLINTVIQPQLEIRIEYAHKLLRSVPFQEEYYRYGKGIVADLWSTNYSEMRNIYLAVPPKVEQQAIVSFLDRETQKIDVLVAEQEKLIELLKEKRQAVISHAVTKGLNPNAKMKDSGIEWLGEVPEHWSVMPIKYIGWLKGGAGFPHEEQGISGEELDFHKVNALSSATDGILQSGENTISRDTALRLGAFVFPPRAIVFAKVGAALLLGRIRELAKPACIDNNMMGLIVNQDQNEVSFIRYAMSLIRFDLIANPGAVPSLNEGQIGNFPLALPSIEEQIDIVTFLDTIIGKLDALTLEAERAIELLKERRSALISAAVTGKIDVRNLSNAKEAA